jgi:uncharacterized cupin superfamily protein
MRLHPDFDGLTAEPGAAHFDADGELFAIVNLLALGGDPERPSHTPVELGRTGSVGLWESTGSANRLPFWNTVYDGDTYLYIVHGSVRVEFKETDGERRLGHYTARTGDLFRLPNGVAHRTFSGDGRRRITLEILPRNPHWDLRGTRPIVVDRSRSIGSFTFEITPAEVLVHSPAPTVRCPRELFGRALRALCEWELHLGHNELDGGLVVHDRGLDADLRVPGHEETLDGARLTGLFAGLIEELGESA